MPSALCLSLLCLPCLLFLPACTPEEKVVNYKPFFAGLDAAGQGASLRHGQAYVKDGEVVGTSRADISKLLQQPIVIENDDGSVTLVSKSGSHLMRHIQRTLYEDDRDLFTEQVLSRITREEYVVRGKDPGEAFDALKEREREIMELFARMPLGENTPQVVRDQVGHNMFRVRVTGVGVSDLYWRGVDMVLEGGNWRLRWFVK